MRRCSYTWEGWDKERQCPEETWSGSEKYCIFHDPSLEKDTELFEQKLKEKLVKKDYNFRGYCFPEWTNFVSIEFEEYADFIDAAFQKGANFSGAAFQHAGFSGAAFQHAYFWKTTFQNAYFTGTTFQYADFRGATFQDADFSGATFQKYVNLWEATFQHIDFRELERIYRDLKQNLQRDGNYSEAGEFYYREMEMRRIRTKVKGGRLWLEFYRLLAGYGEKPARTLLSSFFTIVLFAFVYWALGCLDYAAENIGHFEEFIYSLYFSFVTFTTLGIGDIKPLTHTGRLLICCEAVIGAFLIALFVVVFARKMMR